MNDTSPKIEICKKEGTMKRWLFVHGIGLLSKKYSMLSEQAERVNFLAREFGVNYIKVLEDKNAQLSRRAF